ncbi:MAG: hypothetical protein OEQ74_00555 [Gammaproteobacteria bacterium]|nr:hypothetical protein [Gammaproteobacteria bacterium]
MELASMSSFGCRQLAAAVRRINQRGNAMLLWDEQEDIIRDGRIKQHRLTHSEDCQSCGSSVNVEVRTSQTDYVCPYCGGGLDCSRINPLLDSLKIREEHDRPPRQMKGYQSGRNFSLTIFILLLVLFWPVAILYALKMNSN